MNRSCSISTAIPIQSYDLFLFEKRTSSLDSAATGMRHCACRTPFVTVCSRTHEGEQCPTTNHLRARPRSGSRSSRVARCSPAPPGSPPWAAWPRAAATATDERQLPPTTAAPPADATTPPADATTPPADGSTPPAASGDEVTFGSNYSDPKDSAAIAAAVEGHRVERQDQHGRPQHVPGEHQHLHPAARRRGVLVRRLPHACFAGKGVVGDISDVWADCPTSARASRAPRPALDGKQYFVPFYFYPWADPLPQEPVRREGLRDPDHVGRLLALCDKMKADGLVAVRRSPTTATGRRWACST